MELVVHKLECLDSEKNLDEIASHPPSQLRPYLQLFDISVPKMLD